jgi:hypothetical protein
VQSRTSVVFGEDDLTLDVELSKPMKFTDNVFVMFRPHLLSDIVNKPKLEPMRTKLDQ